MHHIWLWQPMTLLFHDFVRGGGVVLFWFVVILIAKVEVTSGMAVYFSFCEIRDITVDF